MEESRLIKLIEGTFESQRHFNSAMVDYKDLLGDSLVRTQKNIDVVARANYNRYSKLMNRTNVLMFAVIIGGVIIHDQFKKQQKQIEELKRTKGE